MILKMSCVNNQVNIYTENLKKKLNWKTTKTLKKYLCWLKDHKYIDYNFQELPRQHPIKLVIRKLIIDKENKNNTEQFIQVSVDAINKIINTMQQNNLLKLKEMAIRLYYYYVKQYNIDIGSAFVSYEIINKDTGISNQCVKQLNDIFQKNKIVKVVHGKWYKVEISEDTYRLRREVNKYVPKLK
jgi:hypothetical protein